MKYRFEVHFMNKVFQKVSKLMRNLDMGSNIYSIKEIVTFTLEKSVSIQELKDLIVESYQSENCEVVHIEGGKVE